MKWDELTPMQESFCVHYTTIGSVTFSCGVKSSALAAGYAEKSAGVSACQLLKKDIIWGPDKGPSGRAHEQEPDNRGQDLGRPGARQALGS